MMLEVIAKEGLTFPFGTCPSVGVVGYSIGGGIGPLSKHLGIGASKIISARLVFADGSVKEASDEVLWVLRGAGNSSIGVVTELTLQLEKTVPINWTRFGYKKKWFGHIIGAMAKIGECGARLVCLGIFLSDCSRLVSE
jgi:FAD/FMN-containing dehydrogenase